jgi:octaprenyl-diphosphate synthase
MAGAATQVLPRLERTLEGRGQDALALRLAALQGLIGSDLADVEEVLRRARPGNTPAHLSAGHLLCLDGKRLRPACLALAARTGRGFSTAARDLAIAVELVHNATLLHDDVVDLGDVRRGAPTARLVYGNAASIFAGDLLLVEALERIQAAGLPGLIDRAFSVLKEMLDAESLQLANRGRVRGIAADYFKVVEGKTASLFGWALYAGGRAGGAPEEVCLSLEKYGRLLGVAFQVIDDTLDVAGAEDVIGKSVLTDLREGKITWPVMRALERDPALATRLEAELAADRPTGLAPALAAAVEEAVRRADSVEEARALASRLCADAAAAVSTLPPSEARESLESIAAALPWRKK